MDTSKYLFTLTISGSGKLLKTQVVGLDNIATKLHLDTSALEKEMSNYLGVQSVDINTFRGRWNYKQITEAIKHAENLLKQE